MTEDNKLLDRCRDYFKVFFNEIILSDNEENRPFHNELDDDISEELSVDSPGFKLIQRFLSVLTYPRDHGKSKHLSVGFPLWRIAKNHNLRILQISRTATVAESFLSEIVSTIERNHKYAAWAKYIDPNGVGIVPRTKLGRKQTEDWSGKSITIEREDSGLKDPTIAATGLFGQILSRRADIIICDDVVDQQNSMTDLQRRKVIDWIETTVLPVLVPGGSFIYLGNTWHMEDVVSKFLNDPRFTVQKHQGAIIKDADRQDLWAQWGRIMTNVTVQPKERFAAASAFYDENREDMDKGVQVLWADRYPYSRLYLERLLNPYVFARMYQCDPSDRPDQKFKDEWIERALARGKNLRMQDTPHERNIRELSAGGMDVAAGLEQVHDDTAVTYLDLIRYGYDGIKDGDFIIRNIHRGHYTFEEQVEQAKNAIQNGMSSVRVESNGYQKVLTQRLSNDHVVITDYSTGREKFDPVIGVGALTGLFERDEIVIPSDDTDMHTMEVASKLATELRAWTGDSTEHAGDSLMALWFAWSECKDLLGSKILIPSGGTRIKDSPPVHKAEDRAPMEKQADQEMTKEQEYERSNFNKIMRMRMLNLRK